MGVVTAYRAPPRQEQCAAPLHRWHPARLWRWRIITSAIRWWTTPLSDETIGKVYGAAVLWLMVTGYFAFLYWGMVIVTRPDSWPR